MRSFFVRFLSFFRFSKNRNCKSDLNKVMTVTMVHQMCEGNKMYSVTEHFLDFELAIAISKSRKTE